VTYDSRVRVPAVDAPLVSVLMVTFGACEWVERSVRALVEHTPPVYELIVVDNGSTDGTREFLRSIDGAQIVEAEDNLGFAVGNDLAALRARGEYLCLLNSDAIVPSGWLDPLLAVFADPRVGALVPAYLFPDGTLQEAGAVVEPDGRVVPLGMRADATDPQWGFRRVVSYGSAACLVIRRRVFETLGGFDPEYGVAYYEDVDLAFRLRAHALRVMFEPAVRVVHAQGASSPTHADAVALRDANQSRFHSRWKDDLWHRPEIVGVPQPHRFVAARDVESVDRVLLLATVEDWSAAAMQDIALAVARALDEGLVTVAALGGLPAAHNADELLGAGIELVTLTDPVTWLVHRMCHYALVVGSTVELERLAASLRATQPQATLVEAPSQALIADAQALDAWLLGFGLVPASATDVSDRRF
jgi:GT2 family glycosyltransferase